jgi:potassium-dependent mechanosensitive channel
MEAIARQIQPLISTPIFSWGKTEISLYTLFSIAFVILLISVTANFLSRLLKRSLALTLKLDRGTLEAIASIFNYLILGLGIIITLQTAGINLSSFAVLAGVLGIGFGLGLQNITSSFVGSLVLLFEQTIKVGDYIEVEGLAGTVEKISIRSTLVRTTDNMFVIVPNLQLIEHKTINWSYGGHTCRIHLPITIAYDSDTLLVTEALLVAARADARVLVDPEPEVWLREMGDHGLKFELLIWINQPEMSLPIKSAVYFQIEQELRHRQIIVPYPQLELHLRGENHLSQNLKLKLEQLAEPNPTSLSKRSLADLLRQITYFEQCTEAELRSLIASGYRQNYTVSEFVCHQNEPSEEFFIILSGAVEVISAQTGECLAQLGQGEFFGEISVLMGIPRTASIRAITSTTLFVVSQKQLAQLMSNHPNLSEQIAQKLTERQQVLVELGILKMEDLNRKEPAVIDWVRSRLTMLFGIQFAKKTPLD